MAVDRRKLREQIHALYRAEHEAMGERGTLDRLDQARRWDLAPTLSAGGELVFPHAGVLDCGHQIAAVVVVSATEAYMGRRSIDRMAGSVTREIGAVGGDRCQQFAILGNGPTEKGRECDDG